MKKRKVNNKNIKDIFNISKRNIVKYFKHNRLFLSYLLLSFINCFLVRYLTVGNWYNYKTLFIDLSVNAILGSFVYLFKVNKQYYYLAVLMFLNTFVCTVNAIYYSWYSSFASFSLLSALGQVGEVGDAVLAKLKVIYFIYLIPFGLFIYINSRLNKKDYFSYMRKIEKG